MHILPRELLRICILLLATEVVTCQENEKCTTEAGRYVTCVYRNRRASFLMPANVLSMQLEIWGASGGAGLHANNTLEEDSRGLGVYFTANISTSTPIGTKWLLLPPENGASATKTKSGKMANRFWGDKAGDGGSPGLALHRRYAAAGGSAGLMLTPDFRALVCIGGGGGSGAFSTDGFSKGGDAGFLPSESNGRVVGRGAKGFPTVLGGESGTIVPGKGGMPVGLQGLTGLPGMMNFFVGGEGASCHDDKGEIWCFPGGGGGAGYRGGGGGGSYATIEDHPHASAGGGGAGSSILIQDQHTFHSFRQSHVFSADPRIVISYELAEVPKEAKSSACVVM